MTVNMWFGQHRLAITENDLILENEDTKDDYRYLIITRKIGSDRDSYHPKISKTMFNDLSAHGVIYTNNELRRCACDEQKSTTVTYWKLKMVLLNEFYG